MKSAARTFSTAPTPVNARIVEELSMADGRKLLAEIRALGVNQIISTTRLSNGMLAQEFALFYVISMRKKRQQNTRESKAKRKQQKR